MTLTQRCGVLLAGAFIAGCAAAAQTDDLPVSVPIEHHAAGAGEPATLRITMALPQGTPATVSTPSGEPIGRVFPYAGSGRRTYTFVLSPEVSRRDLRTVVIKAAGVQLDPKTLSAKLSAPPR